MSCAIRSELDARPTETLDRQRCTALAPGIQWWQSAVILTDALRQRLDEITENGNPESHPDLIAQLRQYVPHAIEVVPSPAPISRYTCVVHALNLVENKEYEEGFNLYQQGFKTGERIVRPYLNKDGGQAEFWEGEDLKGKSIVFHGEQGVGDELLFLQFIPEFVKAHPDTHLVLDVHPRLCSMIQRSFPDISDIFPTRKTKPEWNESIRVDYKDGLGSLPKWYHSARRKNSGWLKPDEYLTGCYEDVIKEIQATSGQIGRPVIGIAWSGGKKKTRVDLRSIPLPEWRPILEQDATFISLEYWPDAEQETSKLLKNHGLYLHHWPDVVEDQDYEHTVALAAACDLVICVNTSIVHVRGSMDKPCWTLTPHGHAWRYGKKDEFNPFYNSVKQYHQNEGQEWSSVIKVVEKDLKRFIRNFK